MPTRPWSFRFGKSEKHVPFGMTQSLPKYEATHSHTRNWLQVGSGRLKTAHGNYVDCVNYLRMDFEFGKKSDNYRPDWSLSAEWTNAQSIQIM